MSETTNIAVAPGSALKEPRRGKAPVKLLSVPAAVATQFSNVNDKAPGQRPRTKAPSTVPSVPAALGDVQMVPKEVVLATFGLRSASPMYDDIQHGLMVEPIRLSARCSRWLVSEIKAVAAARAAGTPDGELKQLVQRLHAARKAAAPATSTIT